jgi:hypothetical protein
MIVALSSAEGKRMLNMDYQTKPSHFSSIHFVALIVTLVMLPIAAHAELACCALAGGTIFGRTTISTSINGEKLLVESSIGSDFQNTGFGCGLVYWLVRAPVIGAGLDYYSSRVGFSTASMDFVAVCLSMLLRLEIGAKSAFLHGRIVPYLGFGIAALELSGQLGTFPGLRPEDSPPLCMQGSGIMAKGGVEWIIGRSKGFLSGLSLALFLEGRCLVSTLENQDEEHYSTSWGGGWSFLPTVGSELTQAEAELSYWQLAIGISLHLGVR